MQLAAKKEIVFPDLIGFLYEAGHLSEDQARVILLEQKKSGRLPEDLVLDLGFLDRRVLEAFLLEKEGCHLFDPSAHLFDPKMIQNLPRSLAEKHQMLPLFESAQKLHIACVDPYDVLGLDAIKRFFPKDLEILTYRARAEELFEILDEAYGNPSTLHGLLDVPQTAAFDIREDASPASLFLETLLRCAVKERASDIHLEPDALCVHIRLRIDGVLRPVFSFHKDHWSALLVCTKILSGLNIAESRLPQNGRFTKKIFSREVDFRVATHPTLHGENIVLRVLDKLYSLKNLDNLGFHADHVQLFKRQLLSPEGLIFLTGPTGSGKTTTLYSMLSFLKTSERNVMTLEEPIEYELKGIRQSAIKDLGGIRFDEGVRSLLRQDPDVIFIGEVRDPETAQMAVRASMTGHLVLTTLHANDIFATLPRLHDLGLSYNLLEGNILSLVAQRLVRRLCENCKQSKGESYLPQGCEQCGFTGYKGRVAIAEVLEVDEELDTLIRHASSRQELIQCAIQKGFKSLLDHGLERVQKGETSLDELHRVLRGGGRLK